jgi:hypothetical protein
MRLSASLEVKLALAAARRIRRPMPLLRATMAAAEQAGSFADAGASFLYGPDYSTVLTALLATPRDPGSGAVRRPGSPLRAVATRAPERLSRSGAGTGRAPGTSPPQAGALRAVPDAPPPARPAAPQSGQRRDIAKSRAELRRVRLSDGHARVAPAAAAMERFETDRAVGPRPAAGGGTPPGPAGAADPSAVDHGRAAGPGEGVGAARSTTAERLRAARRLPPDPGADVSPEPALAPAAALRAAALARGATVIEDGPPGFAAPADGAAGPEREPPGRAAAGSRERSADVVAGAAPLAAVSSPITPPARRWPSAAGAPTPGSGEPVTRPSVPPPAARPDPARLDDKATALAEAAWRNGVDAA